MASVQLPPQLAIGQGHGKVPWLVRAIWEEHLGWFRFESSTELYSVPPTAMYADFVELAGGVEPVLNRARRYLADGKPLQALHLAEAARAADAGCVEALQLQLAANEYLLAHCGRENFSEVRWLEAQIRSFQAALQESGS